MIKIVKASELTVDRTLVTVIYGQPGIGKTTLAATAEKPLLFDFDAGIHRAEATCDIVPCQSWSEVEGLTADDVKGYRTLIIDTGGQCVNALKRDIMAGDPRMATNTGSLTLNGYGVLKDRFSDFVAKIRSTKTDLVIVMHATEQKDGESVSLRLDVAGGSKDEIHRVADVMGLLRLDSKGQRELVLTPTLAGYAKNPIGLDRMPIGEVWQSENNLASLHAKIRQSLEKKWRTQTIDTEPVDESRLSDRQAEESREEQTMTMSHPSVAQFDTAMERLKSDKATLDDFNSCLRWLQSFDHTPAQFKQDFETACKAKGLAYSNTTKSIIDPSAV